MDVTYYVSREDIQGILPEIILLVAALVILSLEMLPKRRPSLMLAVSLLGLMSGSIAVLQHGGERSVFSGMLSLSAYTMFLDLLYMAVGIASLVIAQNYLERRGGSLRGEYYALILFAVIGMMLMTRANDLVIVFLGLELLSLSLYVLVGFLRHDIYSNEGGLKYLLLGAFATGFFLFGAALIYGTTGTTNLEQMAVTIGSGGVLSQPILSLGIGLLIVGFAFKVAIVPFHMWSPDVYQGAPTTITAFLCTAPKAAGFGALLKVFIVGFSPESDAWVGLLWILAVLTMTVGNLSALVQSDVKRMLAFSSVAHAGYLLIGVLVFDTRGIASVLFYLIVYAAMNLGAFAIVSIVEKGEMGLALEDYRGLAARHPWLSAVLSLFMISLAGFPPTAGFTAKYAVFSAAISKGHIWLVVIAVLNTLVSVIYYVRLIVNMYMQKEKTELATFVSPNTMLLLAFLAAVVILFGLMPQWLLENARQAATVFS
ncbi:MAG: NADH-quinone oxidoreductase subunit N [Candidatus Neomarinimicrobiota bacterium]